MTVHRIPVGSGSPEGVNSAYLLPDRGVLVDPGPPGAWDTLRDGIAGTGTDLAAIDHVLVTHWHVDHAGLAPRLADRADATVHMHRDDAPLLADYAAERERRLERDARRLREWGVPGGVVERIREGDHPSPIPDTVPVDGHEDGDRIGGVSVLSAPGHTLGHAAFEADGHRFVGDAVLATYTPNVGGGDTRLEGALGRYFETLDRLEGYGGTAHPGHGSVLDLDARIDEIRAHHRERSRRARTVVRDRGPVSPWGVAERLFGGMERVHAKMGAGEAASHLDWLGREGEVTLVDREPLRYGILDE